MGQWNLTQAAYVGSTAPGACGLTPGAVTDVVRDTVGSAPGLTWPGLCCSPQAVPCGLQPRQTVPE